MAKRSGDNWPEPKPPTISLIEGKRRLVAMLEKADALLSSRPLSEQDTDTWANQTIKFIRETFGEDSAHQDTFWGPTRVTVDSYDSETFAHEEDQKLAGQLQRRRAALNSILSALDTEIAVSSPAQPQDDDSLWSKLHPAVTQVARGRYEAKQYADAVLASLRELNTKIKNYVKKATGLEYDGADLMLRAFSVNNPIVRLGDLSTEDGKNIQQGYMQIFAGAMTAIRNPKSHSNVTIDADRAVDLLHFASLLHHVFDERL